jgi:uncharacterized oligopeptide transporter (OPT) family protein
LSSAPEQPQEIKKSFTFKESVINMAPYVQTLTLLGTGAVVLMSGVWIVSNLESKIANAQIEIQNARNEADLKIQNARNEADLKIQKVQSESARIALETYLKYNHSEEYATLRKPESFKAKE